MFVYAKRLEIPNAEIIETRRGDGNRKVARCHVLLGAAMELLERELSGA